MNRARFRNPWLAALLSWIVATGIATLVYGGWKLDQGQPIDWGVVRMAAGLAGLIAFLRAFLDRGKA